MAVNPEKPYQNKYLNTIVDVSLDNLGDKLFLMISRLQNYFY